MEILVTCNRIRHERRKEILRTTHIIRSSAFRTNALRCPHDAEARSGSEPRKKITALDRKATQRWKSRTPADLLFRCEQCYAHSRLAARASTRTHYLCCCIANGREGARGRRDSKALYYRHIAPEEASLVHHLDAAAGLEDFERSADVRNAQVQGRRGRGRGDQYTRIRHAREKLNGCVCVAALALT